MGKPNKAILDNKHGRKKSKGDHANDEDAPEATIAGRRPFTPGWNMEMNSKELLPTKAKDGRVFRPKVVKKESDQEAEAEAEDDRVLPRPGGQKSPGATTTEEEEEEEDDFESEMLAAKGKDLFGKLSIAELQKQVANICLSITSDPERALTNKTQVLDDGATVPKLADLLVLLKSPNYQVVEIAMLSCTLVFKDICPGYRIRSMDKQDKNVQLKKETKRLRDFENNLLKAYQHFLKFIETKVLEGLGSPTLCDVEWGAASRFGLSALRCQCELLRTMSHFNFRNKLVVAVVQRAAQPQNEISDVCCATIKNLFDTDVSGELSYEIVKEISAVMNNAKHTPFESFLECLNALKLRVHANESKALHRKEKQNRRKRRRDEEDVDAELMEANATAENVTKKRFQADILHEVTLIYFRIIKRKIGFSLVPAALKGLGQITHLINIDIVDDLVALLRQLIEATPPPPVLIRVYAMLCALRTISGPGEELQVDDTIFLNLLENILLDEGIIDGFETWDVLLECVEIAVVKKRLDRDAAAQSILHSLLHHAFKSEAKLSLVILSVVHAVLLRYPRLRSSLAALARGNRTTLQDEEVTDLAMMGLTAADPLKTAKFGGVDKPDASWGLVLLAQSLGSRFKHVIGILTSPNISPLPYRLMDAKSVEDPKEISDIDKIFETIRSPAYKKAISTAPPSQKPNGVAGKGYKKNKR
jgi:nucleolar complex protein 3